MEKLKMHTPDLAEENYKKLAALFPDAVTETIDENGNVVRAIDKDVLMQEINAQVVDDVQERYQFTWPDKRKSVVLANAPIAKTLRFEKEKSVGRDGTPGGTDSENIYIEGDNLDALKLLQETYLGKVKMIYIDPPYNTGSDEFVFDDDRSISESEFEDISGLFDGDGNLLFNIRSNNETNGRFHTDWLNMMYPRLKIAKDFLSDDGLIFISIDDNEIYNMTKICNEIFGEDNHVETVIWKNKYGAGAKTVGFISAHEYILIYSKNPISNLTCEFEGPEREKYNKKDSKYSTRGPYRTQPLMTNSLGDRPNLMYSIYHNGVEIIPRKQWVWSKERLEAAIRNDDVEFSLQKDGSYTVRSKSYLYDENGNARRGKPVSILNGPFTQDGTKEMRELFNDKAVFDFTKPSKLIEYLIKLEVNDISNKDFVVMDFFSGSGTTAQSVLQANSQDHGRRRFILVQLPELCTEDTVAVKEGYSTICDIGEERIRRAGKKIKEETGADIDYGFRCFKVDSSNMKDVYYRPAELGQTTLDQFTDNIKEDRTPEDLLIQVMLDLGVLLSSKVEQTEIAGKKVFSVADGYLIACFDQDVTDEVVTAIAKRHPFYAVFRDSSMVNDSVAANFEQIFETFSPQTVRKVL